MSPEVRPCRSCHQPKFVRSTSVGSLPHRITEKVDPHLQRATTTRKASSIVGPGPSVVHAVSVSIPQMYELTLSWRRAPPSSRHARQTCRQPQDGIGFSEGTRARKKHVCVRRKTLPSQKKPRLISHVRCPNLYIQAWTQDYHSQIVPCVQRF